MTIRIYLARHASPDMTRTDIPYDVPPGPPLSAGGEAEARLLGVFLRDVGVARVYASPFVRAHRTAMLAAALTATSVITEAAIGEWHVNERAREVIARVEPVLARASLESAQVGPVCLVSHGGPIAIMLRKLGMARERIDEHCQSFGLSTPLPPAGVWLAQRDNAALEWQFELAFMPS